MYVTKFTTVKQLEANNLLFNILYRLLKFWK